MQSSAEAKIELFMRRFRGRGDVYAYAWQNNETKGWAPSRLPRQKNLLADQQQFRALTEGVIDHHLRAGGQHIGLYVMSLQSTCWLLACDFDGQHHREHAGAYAQVCREAGLDPMIEVSRSGDGAHVWLFFAEEITAGLARRMGMRLLRRAVDASPGMEFSSYDRFFSCARHVAGEGERDGAVRKLDRPAAAWGEQAEVRDDGVCGPGQLGACC